MKRQNKTHNKPTHPCEGCVYARHGLVCYDRDGGCLRTDMQEIAQRQQKKQNDNMLKESHGDQNE